MAMIIRPTRRESAGNRLFQTTQLPTQIRSPGTRLALIRRLQSIDFNGGRDRARTCGLLRVKQSFLPNSSITEHICLQENSI